MVRSVLVTGASGFIGQHLARRLASLGHAVTGLDLVPARRAADSYRFVRGDVRRPCDLDGLVPEGGWVFHLASIVGVVEVIRKPEQTYETSVAGTECVCEIAARRGARVVFASSSEVYGDGGGRILREDDPLPASYGSWPRASYPEGKLRAEQIVQAYPVADEARVARLFNVSGPGQSWRSGMVLPTFVSRALAGKPLPVIGDGRDLRCFQHVEDVVAGLIRLARFEGHAGVVNLGGREVTTVRELADRVLRVLGVRAPVISVTSAERYGAKVARCRHRVPDVGRAARLLGHRAQLTLDDMISGLANAAGARVEIPADAV